MDEIIMRLSAANEALGHLTIESTYENMDRLLGARQVIAGAIQQLQEMEAANAGK